MDPSASVPSPRNSARPRRRTLISLTPLIDVVFILLIFFMLASSFLHWRSIALDAPARSAAGSPADGAMLIRLLPDGRVDLSGEALTADALEARLRDRLAADPGRRILVKPETGVSLQRAVSLLDRIVSAGGRDVSLVRGGGPGDAPR